MFGRGTDVAALGVENHGDVGIVFVNVADDRFEHFFAAAARGKVGDLRLEGAHQIVRGVDDARAELQHGLGVALQFLRKARGIRIQPHAEERVVVMPTAGELFRKFHESKGRRITPSGRKNDVGSKSEERKSSPLRAGKVSQVRSS